MTVERIGRAMTWSVVGRIAGFCTGIAANIIVIRSLGSYQWGIISALKSITGFVVVLVSLGLGNALLKFLPELRIRGGLKSFIRSFRRLVLVQVLLWLLFLVLARLGGSYVGGFFNDRFERFGVYLMFAVGFLIFEIFMTMIANFLQAWYRTKKLNIVIVSSNIGYLLLLVLFIKLEWGVVGYLAAGALAHIGALLVLFPYASSLPSPLPAAAELTPSAGVILGFSLPFVVTGLLNQIVWRHSEVLFLGHFHGLETAGYFGLAYRIPQLMLEFIPITIWPLIMAGTSEAYSRNSGDLPRAIDTYYRLLYLLVVPIAALGFAFSRSLIPLVYGVEMLPAALLTQLFFVVFSYSFLYTPLSMSLYVIGKSWVNMLVFAALAVVNVGLDLAFIPRYGLWGAFFPVSMAFVLGVIAFRTVLGRIRPDVKIPVSFILRCYAAALPTAFLAVPAFRWASAGALAFLIPAGLVLLVLGFRFLRVFGEREKELIRKLPLPLKERIISIL